MLDLTLDTLVQQRWKNTPASIRRIYLDDLARIVQLLDEHTYLDQWSRHQQHAKKHSANQINQVYADLLEMAQLRKAHLLQLVLEQRLARKRADELAHIQHIQQQEQHAQLTQLQTLQQLNLSLQQQNQAYADRYHRNVPLSALENLDRNDVLRLRLELEAEVLINEQVQQFRHQLTTAAHEEIDLIIKQHADD